MNWVPTEKQKEALIRREFEILFGGARGGGKDLLTSTRVLTDSGWKKAGEISLEDRLVSPSGVYTKILGIYPKYDRSMYKITFIDGRSVICDAEHNWSVYSKDHGYRDGWVVRNTKKLLNNPKGWSIPLVDKSPGKKWEGVDPYIVGYMMGNGTLTSDKEIIYTVDGEVIDYLDDAGWSIHDYSYMNTTLCNTVKPDAHKYQELLGKVSGQDKCIPQVLLESEHETRLALLQGLMDSDGSCGKEGQASFCNKSLKLCEGLQYLVRSLGGKAVIHNIERGEKFVKGYKTDGQYYEVSVSYIGKFKPFRLSRKVERLHMDQKEDKLGIVSIEKVDDGDGVCFEVEHESHQFVIEDFIVTHNTDTGMAFLAYNVGNPMYRALVIRRNADDLRDWIDRARTFYARMGAEVVGNPAEIRFPSHAIIKTGHLKDEEAYTKYQGHEYQNILIEELTQIAREDDYMNLIMSCRSTVDGLIPQVFATTNPGGVGHDWVKARFIDVANPGEPYTDSTGLTRVFIQAKVEDNPHLMEKDPMYVKRLESLPPNQRRAWREGLWDNYDIEGSFYGSIIGDIQREGHITSVPYEPHVPVDTAWDLGIGDATAIWFIQLIGKEIRLIDYLENEGEGLRYYIKELHKKPYVYGTHYAPHDIAVRELTTGKTRLATARELGVRFRIVKRGTVEEGIDQVRDILPKCWFDEKKTSQGLKALRNYRKEFSTKRREFKSGPLHDWSSHGSDAFRTFAMGYREQYKPMKEKIATTSRRVINKLTGY